MIKIDNVQKTYADLPVLKGITFDVQDGEIFGVVGRSGAGKSTLLRCINGLEAYDSGSIMVDGTEVRDLSDQELRNLRKNIGMVFQNYPLISRASVYENIALAMKIWKCEKEEIDNRVKELLDIIDLSEKSAVKARNLSGGQKQRVATARALAMNPKILLCDEATSALDPNSTGAIISLLKKINQQYGITIVVVTHEMDVVKALCDRMTIMEGGVLKTQGSVLDVFLERSQALNNLLGTEPVQIPENGVTYEIISESDKNPGEIISLLARNLDTSVREIQGETYKLKNKIVQTVIINLDETCSSGTEAILNEEHIEFRRILSEDKR